ncbi:Cof-type HAD-IIB family hydrolase [Fructobacillus evanidus]|uniref:Hydroxymethylpyrimidine pyrophosphatase and other HAD family phosphatases (Cof) n=1 Tax=Fructobacillus evanidus TaxID=3064281 RepID=A0ABM9N0R1_9LACO|nr:Hydroxymethylpyrimidine pyrophosphatase and other HAD family phosphatases (Cof) [Fructobacillus sp. LMG 32999]CAK1247158.1 Hydroxymethylpyrimidine pyrophosphatase and other HAD family phosphatases (Cof) [Fructobacillus sp. LMG 32999]CAK1252043.1 Hydroxymethylpyrimidine pyrophosphatase and other HAD family phosphatases (Cof) [Fructobacillus sp. LMG 32999]CAK1252070.1 Hydroxymethylpyrimidine pyrophosphatase and other HAD family phosphatases (Cof) [Fructobacillus sp. LMG 32999]CAK1252092.1 Hydr
MQAIKLVSIDIDGTLYNDNREITPAVKSAIQKATAQGVHVVITTGRPETGVKKILNELDLLGEDHYVITHNGGLVQTTDGQKTLHRAALTWTTFLKAQQFAADNNTYIQVESDSDAYTVMTNVNIFASQENFVVSLPLTIKDEVSELKETSFVKAIAIGDEAFMDSIQAKVPAELKQEANVVRSTPNNLEFMNTAASKGQALLALAKELGIDQSETMAIGDQENDHTMIEAAGIGVAMGNAVPSIKAIANQETTDNNHDGVAKAIERFILAD